MEYHVLKRTIKTKGKSIHRWYYSYIDLVTQKKIQRVCDGVKNQAEAYAFISNLPAISSKQTTIADIAKDMFIPCSDHVKRLEMLGKKISQETLLQQRHYIELIIQKFGSTPIEDLQVRDVTNYLMTINDKSGSWKNCYIQALGQIFDEVPWHTNKTILKPHFPRFVRNSKKADIFTTEELNLLFIPSLWCGTKEYLLFLCVATCGLRLGEARALEVRQFLFSERALIVDGFCKKNGKRTNYNKKGSDEDSKLRVVVLPDFTANAVKQFVDEKKLSGNDFVFTRELMNPMRQEYLEDVFSNVIKAARIKKDGRKLVPHSLRFTYVTRMRRTLEADTVKQLAGHSSVEMTDYYTRAAIPEMVKSLQTALPSANNLFN